MPLVAQLDNAFFSGRPASSSSKGLVSKRRDRPYRAGRSPHWVKVKNPASPAMKRAKDAF
jgi:ATP-dependent DNA ligase